MSDSKNDTPSDEAQTRSNYYFFKSTPASEAAKYMPTLLNSESGNPVTPQTISQSSPSPTEGMSKWNTAGTWEERDMSSWAQNRLKALLSELSAQPNPSVYEPIAIVCDRVNGDATLVFSRGKKKAGYDLSVSCSWSSKGKSSNAPVKGTIELPSIDATCDGDFEFVVTVKDRATATDDEVDAMQRAVKKTLESIKQKVAQFEKELKEQ